MKLIIQIPCLNEAETLPTTLAALPRELPGFTAVEVLVLDDGSSDGTAETALRCGAHHVKRTINNLGLARTFVSGLQECLRLGADVIVNTDADNQYHADCIGNLVRPILEGRADLVIGARPIADHPEFSWLKRRLQAWGSAAVRAASGTDVRDAPSGFRAMSAKAASQLNVFSGFTYTIETIIQAGNIGLAVESVPIRVNPATRPSRLIRSIPRYIAKAVATIISVWIVYHPLRFFLTLGMLCLLPGMALGVRFLIHYAMGDGSGKIQSLIACALLIGAGLQLILVGIIAHLIAVNRLLLQKLDGRLHEISRR